MKILEFIFSVFFLLNFQAQNLKVMTYNIRLSLESDKENSWDNRKAEAIQLMDYYHPDFFGVQEAVPQQMVDIKSGLRNYDFVGVGRDDGANKGEYSAIFYDAEKLKVLESGTFWLSETPQKESVLMLCLKRKKMAGSFGLLTFIWTMLELLHGKIRCN